MLEAIAIILFIALLASPVFAIIYGKEVYRLRKKLRPIQDAEAELARLKTEQAQAKNHCEVLKTDAHRNLAIFNEWLSRTEQEKQKLLATIKSVESEADVVECGLYKPQYQFDALSGYKMAMDVLWEKQALLLKTGGAAKCDKHWTVGGSEKEGAKMSKQYSKLMLRAFNGECDAAVAKVAWNNISKMESRITKAYEIANDLGSTMDVAITRSYLELKLAELRLTYEYDERKHQEQEEQKRIREQMREEERAVREIEKAKVDAEQEEARFAKALEKAKAEASLATGVKLQELDHKVLVLQHQLEEARLAKDRVMSRAQMTRSGHVYVISNIGSFGDNVYKVGMTRRLDPMERIFELGDASVPFPFDVHAMMYTEDAPTLERDLHLFLDQRRVNLVNDRKEFFQVTLSEIEEYARKKGQQIEFTKMAEAKEFHESVAIRTKSGRSMAITAAQDLAKA